MSDLSLDHAHTIHHTADELDLRWRQAGARLRKSSPAAYEQVSRILNFIAAEPQSPAREADSGIMRAGVVRDVEKHLDESDPCGVGEIFYALGEALGNTRAMFAIVAHALLHLLTLLDDNGIDDVLRATIEQAKVLREAQRERAAEDAAKRGKAKRSKVAKRAKAVARG